MLEKGIRGQVVTVAGYFDLARWKGARMVLSRTLREHENCEEVALGRGLGRRVGWCRRSAPVSAIYSAGVMRARAHASACARPLAFVCVFVSASVC